MGSFGIFERAEVSDLHEHGLLPESHVANLRSSMYIATAAARVLMVTRLSRTQVPDDFHSRQLDDSVSNAHRGRLLSYKSWSLTKASQTAFAFRTPRDKVLSIAALLAATVPLAAYNVTWHYEQWKGMYDNGTSLYLQWCDNTTTSNCYTLSNDTKGEKLVELDKAVLTASRTAIKATAGTAYKSDNFLGARQSGCAQTGTTGERCFGDEGVAMSVYEDDASLILVFQAGLGDSDLQNLLWQNKAWIVESFEDSMIEQWTLKAQQPATAEMSFRKAEQTYEFPIRCGFLNQTYSPFVNKEAVSAASGVGMTELESAGMWPLIKLITRTVLAEGAQTTKTVYLAGTGLGGAQAALVSMWLKKNEDKAYDTYLIAAPGFQCIARSYLQDLTPSAEHTQLKVYTHVMDALAGSVDRYSGTVCYFGLRNFTSAEPFFDTCSRMVGHTGPEIFWRPLTTTTTTTAKGATEATQALYLQYTENITAAREAFDSCHMVTHSVWYALMLLNQEDTLNLDGSTDGGCATVAPLDKDDKYGTCPTTATATTNCASFFEPSASVSTSMLLTIVGSTGAVIAVCAVLGIIAVRHIQKNAMEDMSISSSDHAPPSGFIARFLRNCGIYVGARGRDRAKEARIRAKKARDKRRNRNYQEKSNLLPDGGGAATVTPVTAVTAVTAVPAVTAAVTVGKQEGEDGSQVDLEDAEGSEKKHKKEKKEKKEKKSKRQSDEDAGDILEAVSVRVVKEEELTAREPDGDDLLGSNVVEKEKKQRRRKREGRETE
ncbi:unnamed protein product [Effrenium voratum]|nr:unnamed protein product [Effrenium voratum]